MRFSSSYFHNTICEWNLLEKSVQDSPSLAVFKSKLLRIIRPEKNPVYNIYDILGIKLLTRLRVNFNPPNEHRFRHNFDCLSPICICGTGKEDNEHYLLHYPQFTAQRQDILGLVKSRMSDMGWSNSRVNQIRKIEQRSRNIIKSKANPSTDLRIPTIDCAIKKKVCTFVFDCLQDNLCDPFKVTLKERNTVKIQEITI